AGVSSEPIAMHKAEPKTIGTTVMNPHTRTSPFTASDRYGIAPSPAEMITVVGLYDADSQPATAMQAATKIVESSAPYLVLRFQKSAASMIGAIAANPE